MLDRSPDSHIRVKSPEKALDESPIKTKACIFTVNGNLRPKSPRNISVGVQVSPEKEEASSQTYKEIHYDNATQTTIVHQLQVRKLRSYRANFANAGPVPNKPYLLVQCTQDFVLIVIITTFLISQGKESSNSDHPKKLQIYPKSNNYS